MASDLSIIDFNTLTPPQFAALRQLTVSARQEVLGKSFLESIEDWESAVQDQVLGLCVLFEDQPVGLTLFQRGQQEKPKAASSHGLKIATPWQRRGWGHQAFRLAVAHLKHAWPDIDVLKLAVDAENTAAIAIYRGFGMTDSGPIFQGPNGLEHRMVVALRS